MNRSKDKSRELENGLKLVSASHEDLDEKTRKWLEDPFGTDYDMDKVLDLVRKELTHPTTDGTTHALPPPQPQQVKSVSVVPLYTWQREKDTTQASKYYLQVLPARKLF